MKARIPLRASSLIVLLLASNPIWAAASTTAPTFRIGAAPPPLEPMAWIKGGPVTRFEPGHVYIVKFFATWCGASNQSMPQLSEVARRHAGKLTVIGVNVREAEMGKATVTAVAEFVEKKGDKMDYIVAMDDPATRKTFHAWMTAAGTYGIPTAFIIGKQGKLVYMGYPIDDSAAYLFDEAVEQALAGTSDLAAARALQAQINRQTAERFAEEKLLKAMRDAQSRKDYDVVLAEADKVIGREPKYAARLFADKLAALLHIDENAAMDYARAQAQSAAIRETMSLEDTQFWGWVGRTIAREQGLSRSVYEQAAGYLRKAAPGIDDEFDGFLNWIVLARLQYSLGNLDEAIAAQEHAIAKARRSKEFPSENVADLEKTLADYKRESGEG